ncbi:MAG: hypothetical protein RL141_16 [Candidatus Parcubacteria bacterium]|jgi:hypothetical protein
MKRTNDIFLSKSVSFAIEMVRASLHHIPTDIHLDGLWMQTNMSTDILGDRHFGQRSILFSILVYPDIVVEASCNVTCTDGKWRSGDVEIRLPSTTGHYNKDAAPWRFHCQIDAEGRLNAQPTK